VKKHLFRFASKRNKAKKFISFCFEANEKIGSKTKNFWKQNKAKIGSINFALVESEKFEEKKQKQVKTRKTKFRLSVQNGSHFTSFCF
jgi:hypothetical protein